MRYLGQIFLLGIIAVYLQFLEPTTNSLSYTNLPSPQSPVQIIYTAFTVANSHLPSWGVLNSHNLSIGTWTKSTSEFLGAKKHSFLIWLRQRLTKNDFLDHCSRFFSDIRLYLRYRVLRL